MAIPFNAAASAYSNAANLISNAGKSVPGGSSSPAQGGEFAQMLADSVQSVVETGKVSDQAAMNMVNGQGNIVDVVTAVAETEVAIQGLVAVRDKVISAYQEIMRMPI